MSIRFGHCSSNHYNDPHHAIHTGPFKLSFAASWLHFRILVKMQKVNGLCVYPVTYLVHVLV